MFCMSNIYGYFDRHLSDVYKFYLAKTGQKLHLRGQPSFALRPPPGTSPDLKTSEVVAYKTCLKKSQIVA